jgi:pimeloyl-ACP methyl ester carboxylesterase
MRRDCFPAYRSFFTVGWLCLLVACSAPIRPPAVTGSVPHDDLAEARQLAQQAAGASGPERSALAWSRCAAAAYRAADTDDETKGHEAVTLGATCTDKLLDYLLSTEPQHWQSTTIDLAGTPLTVELRGISPSLSGPIRLTLADKVSVPRSMGPRFANSGFGVALVAATPRCSDRPLCKVYPVEGIFRPATAWIESGERGQLRLVVSDPLAHPIVVIGSHAYPLAMDISAPAAMLVESSRLNRLAVWNLLGGKQIELRQGVYLLQDYDPHKTPIVMVHGLGASPLIWARLTNRILGTPDLRSRYQIWQVIYQTNAPELVDRLRVQQFLDKAWSQLDPDGQDAARHGMVLIGHSMGGVVARLLTADSGDVLWDAAVTVPFNQVHGSESDRTLVHNVLDFKPYPGVGKAIFLASPHLGSPLSDDFIGRLARRIVTPHGPEPDALRRIVDANPSTVQRDLLMDYRKEGISSISTLSTNQPVSHAAQALMPAKGIRYYTIAGNLPGASVPGDGVVPLASAILAGAMSTIIVTSGHKVYNNDQAIAQIIKILREPPDECRTVVPPATGQSSPDRQTSCIATQ